MGFTIRKLKTAQQITDETIKGVADNADKWLDGFKNPRRNPQEEAKKSGTKWKNAVSSADAQKAFVENVGSYNVDDAIKVAEEVGKDNLVKGVAARKAKILRANQELQPKREAAFDAINAMPTDTDAQREAKMIANKRAMQALNK